MPFSDDELQRYARHIVLREIGGSGQNRLAEASVFVIGAGGLGSPALMYLAAAGIGTIGIVDDDTISLSNLQRQVLYDTASVGQTKTERAVAVLDRLNPNVRVRPVSARLTKDNASQLISEYDLVLDGCDNFETRDLVNQVCVGNKIPLISGAISQWEGQVSLFDPASGTPCYACIFPKAPAEGLAPTCAEAGVVGSMAGVVGSMMATEAIKHITQAGQTLSGEMFIYDALWGESRKISLTKRPDCKVCC